MKLEALLKIKIKTKNFQLGIVRLDTLSTGNVLLPQKLLQNILQ